MPKEYLDCVNALVKQGYSKKNAQKICAIKYYKKYGKTPQQAESDFAEFKPLPFDEAIKLFKDKVILTRDEYDNLLNEVKIKSFTVARIMEADILKDVYDSLLDAIEKGTTFEAFKKSLDFESLGWTGEAAYRLDTVFRTNIQSMYQAGHYKQQMEVVDERLYWQYVAVMDTRTRPNHAAMNGKVFRANDSFWEKNYPPNGFNCRCTVRTLSERELSREKLDVSRKGKNIADEGFDFNPGKSAWKPNLKKYPNWLREKIK